MKHPVHLLQIDPKSQVLYLAFSNKLQACDLQNGQLLGEFSSDTVGIPKSEEKVKTTKNQQKPIENFIRCLKLSRNGDFLVATTDDDKLLIVLRCGWQLSSDGNKTFLFQFHGYQQMPKRPCSISTTYDKDSEKIIIGDKFGDVYCINPQLSVPGMGFVRTEDPSALVPLLGHVSMLVSLDVAINKQNGRQVILTADRDEHIRITRYPQHYVIARFLFGHYQFVSALLLPQWTENILISGGGDKFLCVWNWVTGQLLQRFDMRDMLKKYYNDALLVPEKLRAEKQGDDLYEVAVLKLAGLGDRFILVALEQVKAVFVLELDGDNLKFVTAIEVDYNILDIQTDCFGRRVFMAVDSTEANSETNGPLVLEFVVEESGQFREEKNATLEALNAAGSEPIVEGRSPNREVLYHMKHLRKRGEF